MKDAKQEIEARLAVLRRQRQDLTTTINSHLAQAQQSRELLNRVLGAIQVLEDLSNGLAEDSEEEE